MCGILGTIGEDPGLVLMRGPGALATIAHRGPDDEGTWTDGIAWLGHRRLAIIDLTAGGHQPMVHAPSGVVVTFNGEIYNYIELREELEAKGHVFRTDSDTEVLLAAYVAWGRECLSHFNGMWSFLIWDPRSRSAFFARDRLGVKPLYYTVRGRSLAVASEPKALLTLYPELRRVDEKTLYAFLAEGKLYTGDRSFYSGIQVLPAGHLGTFTPGDAVPRIQAYWTPSSERAPETSYEASLDRFSQLLRDAVRLRMRSDVPVGFTISGGLDSSAVLQAAVSASDPDGERLQAFTSVYAAGASKPSGDERQWARMVAAKYDRVGLDEVEARDDDWLKVLQRIVWHMDGPGYSPAVFPLWKIMARARATGVPVLLEGQGADELLGGYPQYAALALKEQLRRGQVRGFVSDFQRGSDTFTTPMMSQWLMRESFPFLIGPHRQRVGALSVLSPEFARQFGTKLPKTETTVNGRLQADLTRDILPGLLHYGDAISMAHAVESRLPFLDYRLVEMSLSLPWQFKVGRGESKHILRDHLRSVGLADIANRKDKKGYPTPADDWLRANRGELPKTLLLDEGAAIRPYCQPQKLRRLVDYHAAGRGGAGNHLYRLLATEIWLESCIAASPEVSVPGPASALAAGESQ